MMKKLVTLTAVLAMAMMTQAATFNWATVELLDNGGPLSDGGSPQYALPGVDLYLVYNGVGGSFNPANWFYDTETSSLSYAAGSSVNTIVASYVNTLADYNTTGAFSQSLTGVGLTWFGETNATWEAMNTRSFTIVAISDADDDYATGAQWNYFTANASGFSTAQGNDSVGGIGSSSFNVSGAGDLTVIPEPATALLFGIGAMGAWMVRRNKIKSKEQADA